MLITRNHFLNSLFSVLLSIFLFAWSANVSARQEKLINPVETVVGMNAQGKVPTKAAIKQALLRAGPKFGWILREQKDGLVGDLDVRGKHRIMVTIKYTSEMIQVFYRSSENMNYEQDADGEKIHPKYHDWIRNLMRETQVQLSRAD